MALRIGRQTSLEDEEFLLLRDPNAARFFHQLLELCLASQETQGFIYRFHDLSPLFVMSTSIRQLIAALSAPFRNLGKLQERRLVLGAGGARARPRPIRLQTWVTSHSFHSRLRAVSDPRSLALGRAD
jgi:hypothetical protein